MGFLVLLYLYIYITRVGLSHVSATMMVHITMVTVDGRANVATSGKDAHDVPEGVVVVEDSEAVAIRCALLYRHDSGGSTCGPVATPSLQGFGAPCRNPGAHYHNLIMDDN